jgi:N12 class adenine-specific DNA methylase/predicted RNA methylase
MRLGDAAGSPTAQAILGRWSGWGAVPELFDPTSKIFARYHPELVELLSAPELLAASRSTLNAHYTDPRIAKAIWDAVGEMGFTDGRVLEPGCGSGVFVGLAPAAAEVWGVELDPTTAAIAAALYPTDHVATESFADTRLPEGFADLTIGNVPFGDVTLTDPIHNPLGHSIHNHFIVKSLHLTRPGGLVAVITSLYTMDAVNPAARRDIGALADLVYAVRLPEQAHRYAGTQVVTDLLIFRRRPHDAAPAGPAWEQTATIGVGGGVARTNEYFANHRDQVAGDMFLGRGLYRDDELRVSAPPGLAVAMVCERIVASARAAGAEGWRLLAAAPAAEQAVALAPTLQGERRPDGMLIQLDNGEFGRVESGALKAFSVPRTQRYELALLLKLRDIYLDLIGREAASISDGPELAELRNGLNVVYNTYVARYGPINRFTTRAGQINPHTGQPRPVRIRPRQGGFRDDPFAGSVYALERFNPQTQTAAKAEIFTTRVVLPRKRPLGADSAADAVAICLDTHGEVRLSEIARLLGASKAEARPQLEGLVFDDPETGELITAAAYLSGNVRQKLETAAAAAATDERYQANVTALRDVLPADVPPEDIAVRLGGWVGRDYVQAFLRETLQNPHVAVEHAGGTQWAVSGAGWSIVETETWGTEKLPAAKLAERLLRSEPVRVYAETEPGHRELDLEATEAAQRKAADLNERFGEWVWEDHERATTLAAEYNRRFNAIVLRHYDGENLTLPGLARTFTPRPHQLSAVARMIAEPAAGLYHVVGAGKTAEMAIGVMELRRLAMISKAAIVVPNHLVEQFRNEFLQLYPQARVLAAGMDDVNRLGRATFLGRVANNEWDAVIVSRSVFERIPMSVAAQQDYFDQESEQLRTWLDSARGQGGITVKRLEKALLRQEEALKVRMGRARDNGLTFEETGIDYLVVDEAHGYKNRRTPSAIGDLAIDGSKRATDLDMKLRYLRHTHGERVVTFATGTPIANSMTEAYIMMSYLRPDILTDARLDCFDQWAATFAQHVSEIEVAPTGGYRLKSRIAKFDNVPELLRMFHISADIRTADDLDLPTPAITGGRPQSIQVAAPPELADFMADIQQRAGQLNARSGKGEDNVLKLMTESRHAALDVRLVGQNTASETKLDAAAAWIVDAWRRWQPNTYLGEDGRTSPTGGSLQIVFSDLGTPKEAFNVYDELRHLLTSHGMPAERIRFAHDAKTDREKAELFAACRRGDVAVLIGSTEKMGAGTNIQDRARALHHLDVPWRPADVEQREGRILRQGNQNDAVDIVRWVTERSFDAYMWQTLERKAKFIGQLMRGTLDVREIDDIGEAALTYGEIKALAAGDPLLLEKAQAESDVTRLRRLERAHEHAQDRLKWQVISSTNRIQELRTTIDTLTAAIEQRIPTAGDRFAMQVGPHTYTNRAAAGRAVHQALTTVLRNARGAMTAPGEIGILGGFTVTGHISRGRDGTEATLSSDHIPYTLAHTKDLDVLIEDSKAQGFIIKLENSLTGLDGALANAHTDIASNTKQIEQAQHRIGAAFPQRGELDTARARLTTVDTQLAQATQAEQETRQPSPVDNPSPSTDAQRDDARDIDTDQRYFYNVDYDYEDEMGFTTDDLEPS